MVLSATKKKKKKSSRKVYGIRIAVTMLWFFSTLVKVSLIKRLTFEQKVKGGKELTYKHLEKLYLKK